MSDLIVHDIFAQLDLYRHLYLLANEEIERKYLVGKMIDLLIALQMGIVPETKAANLTQRTL